MLAGDGILPVRWLTWYGETEYEKVSVLERPGTGYCIFSCVVVIWQLELVEYIDLVRRIVSCVYEINRLRI